MFLKSRILIPFFCMLGNLEWMWCIRTVMRFRTLDAMRGISALAVVFYHADRMVPRGYFAVDLFFALSGFVLFHAYAHRMDVKNFLIERTVRLAPLMIAGAAIGLAVNGGSPWTLLMIPTGSHVLYPANIPLWSLLFEFVAGAVFAIFFRFGLPAWVAFLALGIFGTLVGIAATGYGNLGFDWPTFEYGLARTALAFCLGIGIYKLVDLFPVRLSGAWFVVPISLPFLAFMAREPAILIDLFAMFFLMPFCLWLGAICSFPSAKLANILAVPSYALYAVHHPLVKMDLSPLITIPTAILLAFALAHFYDRPLRTMIARFSRARPRRAECDVRSEVPK